MHHRVHQRVVDLRDHRPAELQQAFTTMLPGSPARYGDRASIRLPPVPFAAAIRTLVVDGAGGEAANGRVPHRKTSSGWPNGLAGRLGGEVSGILRRRAVAGCGPAGRQPASILGA